MPRKKRDIKREYRKAGFNERPGKGDHTIFTHPLLRDTYAVDGADGKDVKPYDEQQLRQAKRDLAAAEARLKGKQS